jgi:hypothetical protein
MRNVEKNAKKVQITYNKLLNPLPNWRRCPKDRETPPTRPAAGRNKSNKHHQTEGKA